MYINLLFYLLCKEVFQLSNNEIDNILKKSSNVSFLSIDEVQTLTKESFDNWKSDYINRLKNILKTNIAKCAKRGEFNYTFDSEVMTVEKIEILVKAIEKEIIPLLKGYSIDFGILTQTDNFSYARMKMCISWK